jgi:Protein of unknown function (DUF2490)
MRWILIGALTICSLYAKAQNQTDFRGLFSLNLEKKVSKRVSFTGMAVTIATYDFQELGFIFFDTGIKCKLNKHFSTNFNYRFMFRRNLENFYDNRQILYGDLDYSRGYKRWTFGGTTRFQGLFYSRIFDGYKNPLFYNRTKANIKYRVNYYWQPFVETEFFTPLNHPIRKTVDQIRASVGFSYTFNDHIKVEFYEQLQQQINRAPHNTNFLTAINWYFRL